MKSRFRRYSPRDAGRRFACSRHCTPGLSFAANAFGILPQRKNRLEKVAEIFEPPDGGIRLEIKIRRHRLQQRLPVLSNRQAWKQTVALMPQTQMERYYGSPAMVQMYLYMGYAFRAFNTHGRAMFTLAHRAMAGQNEDEYVLTDGERICRRPSDGTSATATCTTSS